MLYLKKTIMKYILLSLAMAITMAACKHKEEVSTVPVVPVYNSSILSDTARDEAIEPNFAESQPKQVKAKRIAHTAIHRKTNSETTYKPPVATPPVVTPVPASTGVNTVPSSTGVDNNAGTGNAGTGTTSTIPQPEKKKGWNKATKGAVIGGVAGAIGGAIISKKKGLGAVIGGVVGAAGGYAIGKKMDKKDNQLILK